LFRALVGGFDGLANKQIEDIHVRLGAVLC
jgi:hypothetical protein